MECQECIDGPAKALIFPDGFSQPVADAGNHTVGAGCALTGIPIYFQIWTVTTALMHESGWVRVAFPTGGWFIKKLKLGGTVPSGRGTTGLCLFNWHHSARPADADGAGAGMVLARLLADATSVFYLRGAAWHWRQCRLTIGRRGRGAAAETKI